MNRARAYRGVRAGVCVSAGWAYSWGFAIDWAYDYGEGDEGERRMEVDRYTG